MIRRAAGNGIGDVVTASVEEIVADRHPASAATDEGNLGAVGFDEYPGDEGAEFGGSVGGGRAVTSSMVSSARELGWEKRTA